MIGVTDLSFISSIIKKNGFIEEQMKNRLAKIYYYNQKIINDMKGKDLAYLTGLLQNGSELNKILTAISSYRATMQNVITSYSKQDQLISSSMNSLCR